MSVMKSTVRLRRPNPLFEKWLYEWHISEVPSGSSETIYSKALESLKKYPLVLNSGNECIILEHFDTQLCLKLNKKLEEHNNKDAKKNLGPKIETSQVNHCEEENNLKKPSKRKKNKEACTSSPEKVSSPKKKTKQYVPVKRSAAYGLLLALILAENEDGYPGFMMKADLQKKAQPHSNVSYTKPLAGSYYTGWSSMSQLVAKGLVVKTSNPAKFSLSDKGRELALSLKLDKIEVTNSQDEIPSLPCDSAPIPSLVSTSELTVPVESKGKKKKDVPATNSEEEILPESQEFEAEDMIFLPSSFEVVLLVDTAETAGAAKRDEDRTIIALNSTGIKYEVRHLKVGDYIWIARDESGREMVLPYIVERKRLDDLGASIKDGRFHEQKFRLKQCGLQNLIYLVEESGLDRNGLPLDSIRQGVSNTMVCDRFSVKWTDNLINSIEYLATVTQILIQTFQNKTLFSCKKSDLPVTLDVEDDIISLMSFGEFSFNMGKVKALTPRETFIKMLVQLHGLSPDKAWAITESYPTPKLLIEGFLSGEAEVVIPNLTFGFSKKRVGPQITCTLKKFYTANTFNDLTSCPNH